MAESEFRRSLSEEGRRISEIREGAKACADMDLNGCTKTPGTLRLKRGDNHVVVIEKNGYLSETIKVTRGQNWIIGFNTAMPDFGITGTIIDNATGAGWTLSPEKITVELSREPAPVPVYE